MSCPGVHTSFVFGLEPFKKTSSDWLDFHIGDVLILCICGFAAFAHGECMFEQHLLLQEPFLFHLVFF